MECNNSPDDRVSKMIREVDQLDYLQNKELEDYATPVLRSVQICELLLMNHYQCLDIPVEDDGRVGQDKELSFIPEKNNRFFQRIAEDLLM